MEGDCIFIFIFSWRLRKATNSPLNSSDIESHGLEETWAMGLIYKVNIPLHKHQSEGGRNELTTF